MNKKEDQDRAVKYLKIRLTEQQIDGFKKYCEALNTDMSKVMKNYIDCCVKTINNNGA